MIRKAKAVWRGGGRVRSDKLFTESGVLAEIPYARILIHAEQSQA
jgi:hypothetical protein